MRGGAAITAPRVVVHPGELHVYTNGEVRMKTKVMQRKNKATAKQVVATEIYKYIRQLELDLGGLGYNVERERPIEITELLNREAPVDAAYQKRFADRVGRPKWLMVRVDVKPPDSDF